MSGHKLCGPRGIGFLALSSKARIDPIVTGGGRDIGRACAIRLAAEGANVAINYFSSGDGAESAVMEIEAAGGKAFALQGDLSSQDGIDALVV